MNFKLPKVKVKNLTNPSHHETGLGGPISLSKIHAPKMSIPHVGEIFENPEERSLKRFKNLMRFLKAK